MSLFGLLAGLPARKPYVCFAPGLPSQLRLTSAINPLQAFNFHHPRLVQSFDDRPNFISVTYAVFAGVSFG